MDIREQEMLVMALADVADGLKNLTDTLDAFSDDADGRLDNLAGLLDEASTEVAFVVRELTREIDEAYKHSDSEEYSPRKDDW